MCASYGKHVARDEEVEFRDGQCARQQEALHRIAVERREGAAVGLRLDALGAPGDS